MAGLALALGLGMGLGLALGLALALGLGLGLGLALGLGLGLGLGLALGLASPGCSQAPVPLWLHKMSTPAPLMRRLLLASVTQLSESGTFSCHLSA